jgi:NADH-quinone oxidoreductase subunit M
LLVGVIYDKAHTRQISDFGGLATKMPFYAVLFTMAGLASLGLPGMSGFVAEFLVFVGSFASLPWLTAIGAAGIVITAGYLLWMIQRVFFGPLVPKWAHLEDARGLEAVPLVCLMAVVILVGVYPGIITGIISSGVAPVVAKLGL